MNSLRLGLAIYATLFCGSLLHAQERLWEACYHSGPNEYGRAVAFAGDLGGDGTPDLAIGARTERQNFAGAKPGQNRVHLVLSNMLRQFSYCPQTPNSSGLAASLAASGWSKVSQSDLSLAVDGLPSGQIGVSLMGPTRIQLPFYSSFRCLGSISRLSSPLQPAPPVRSPSTSTSARGRRIQSPPATQSAFSSGSATVSVS